MQRFCAALLLAILVFGTTSCSYRESPALTIAVASNFAEAAKDIARRYQKRTGIPVRVSIASTGKHYSQIRSGSPIDVFLSADSKHPELLVNEGFAVRDSLRIYAFGKLVLFSVREDLIDDRAQILDAKAFEKLALANPRLAPYGLAAKEVLMKRGLALSDLQGKIVYGESVGQAYQFVATGNADLGFVALSQVKKHKMGSRWIVPSGDYARIEQKAVIIDDTERSREFISLFEEAEILELIKSYGYGTP